MCLLFRVFMGVVGHVGPTYGGVVGRGHVPDVRGHAPDARGHVPDAWKAVGHVGPTYGMPRD